MARATFNVLVIAYRWRAGDYEYAVWHRADGSMWQFIAGGGEDAETPAEAAEREAREEAGIRPCLAWLHLDSVATIPRVAFPGAPWPEDVYVVPEHCFAVDVRDHEFRLSPEHDRVEWLDYDRARERLTWDSNRNALWELRERIGRPPLQPTVACEKKAEQPLKAAQE